MYIGPPWVKRHSKPYPYTLTWENDVIHYAVPVATFSPRFRIQSMPLIELCPLAQTGCKSAHHGPTILWTRNLVELSPLAQTGCKSAHHGSNATRNQIPIPVSYTHLTLPTKRIV